MRIHWLVILALAVSVAACDDEPSGPCGCPGESPWAEVDLGSWPGSSARLVGIDCEGADCLSLGIAFAGGGRADILPGYQTFLHALDAGAWGPADLAGLPVENHYDLALGDSGAPVIVGYGMGGAQSVYATIYDGRTAEPTVLSQGASALLTVDGDGDFFVAGGSAVSGRLVSSQSPGSWNIDTFPATFGSEGGFHDVYVRGDVAVACGFDDGADTLQVVLRRTSSTDWEMVNRDGLEFAVVLRCIAIDGEGTIHVGGEKSPGGPGAQAWAAVRSPAGVWTELVLPDPVELGRVNDVLLAGDGSIYLACSSEYEDSSTAHLVRVAGSAAQEEITPFPGSLVQLAEGTDGTVWAAGSRRVDPAGNREPVLLQRAP